MRLPPPCAGAAPDLPFWIIPNKSLSLSFPPSLPPSLSLTLTLTLTSQAKSQAHVANFVAAHSARHTGHGILSDAQGQVFLFPFKFCPKVFFFQGQVLCFLSNFKCRTPPHTTPGEPFCLTK
jgi:hypothetical protein